MRMVYKDVLMTSNDEESVNHDAWVLYVLVSGTCQQMGIHFPKRATARAWMILMNGFSRFATFLRQTHAQYDCDLHG